MRRALLIFAGIILAAAVWLIAASLLFLKLRGLWGHPSIDVMDYPWQWWRYFSYRPRSRSTNFWLWLSALIAAAGVLLPTITLARRWLKGAGDLRGMTKRHMKDDMLRRGTSMNHGQADWMPQDEIASMFPSEPHPEIGGVVVGERVRMDQTPVAKIAYDPRNRDTWGLGGTAPLMIDHCTRGSTHSLIFGGSGLGNKTVTLATALLVWRSAAVVFDPACELADMLEYGITQGGRRVVRLTVGGAGINVLAGLDRDDPEVATKIVSLVSNIIGPMPGEGGDGSSARFKSWGRDIVTCLLAHIIASSDLAPEDRSLSILRYALMDGGMEGLRARLQDIIDSSESEYARGIAGSFMGWPDETFGGAYANAVGDTEWLGHSFLADLVGGEGFSPAELMQGNVVVFVQIRRDILAERPAVGRVVMGALLSEVFAAEGRFQKRIGFFMDEAALLGPMPILKIVRDLGRKYKITMQLIYQSEQQLVEIWGQGWEAWFDGVAWCSYGTVQSPATAERLAKRLGQYGVEAISVGQNTGTSSRALELMGTNSKGANTNLHEVSRPLMYAHELMQDVRTDERITIVPGRKPMRHGAAIGFRRPEIAPLLSETSFSAPWEPEHQ